MTVIETEIGRIEVPETFPSEWVEEGVLYCLCEQKSAELAVCLGYTPGSVVEFSGEVTIKVTKKGRGNFYAVLKAGEVEASGKLNKGNKVKPGDTAILTITYVPGGGCQTPRVIF